MNILLNGATGRVGRCIEALAADDADLSIVARGRRSAPLPGDVDGDVLVDFSRPDALEHALTLAVERRIPLVTGTTGLSAGLEQRLAEASGRIAIVHASNFAIGVHVLQGLVREAASRLGEDFDIELLDIHHRHKVDAPSGTALTLARAAAEGRGLDPEGRIDAGDRAGKRTPGRIGIQSLRGGDVVGEHRVQFLGDGERLELVHEATDRSLFARGALRAAAWIVDQPPGLYGLDAVLEPLADA